MAYKTQNVSLTIMYASPNNKGDPAWFPNSGSLHTVISDPLNLAIHIKFTRNE